MPQSRPNGNLEPTDARTIMTFQQSALQVEVVLCSALKSYRHNAIAAAT
jgi:hypothetical protein